MFKVLIKFGQGKHSQNFLDQIHANMMVFLCHCNDVSDSVSQQCMNTFQIVSEYLTDTELQNKLNQAGIGKSNYIQLLANVVPILVTFSFFFSFFCLFAHIQPYKSNQNKVEKYPSNLPTYLHACIQYLESKWGEIRGNAALAAAKMIQCVPIDSRHAIDIDAVVKGRFFSFFFDYSHHHIVHIQTNSQNSKNY